MTAIVFPPAPPQEPMLFQGDWAWNAAPVASAAGLSNRTAAVDVDAPQSATKLFIDGVDVDGMDHSPLIQTLGVGDSIFVFVLGNTSSWQQWKLTGVPAATGTIWTIPVQSFAGSAAGTEPTTGTMCVFQFRDTAQGSGSGLPAGGSYLQVLRKNSDTSGDAGWDYPQRVMRLITQNGHGFAQGDILRLSGTTYVKAQADTELNAEVIGMVYVAVDLNNFLLLTHGTCYGYTALTPGAVQYLSPTTAGRLTETEPTTPGQVSKPVMLAHLAQGGVFINLRGNVVPDPTQQNAVLIFNDAAARDAAIPNPFEGQVCWLTSTDQFLVYHLSPNGWFPPWNTAWGLVAPSISPGGVSTAVVGTVYDIPGSTITFTAVQGRQYEISVSMMLNCAANGNRYSLYVTDSANTIICQSVFVEPAAQSNTTRTLQGRVTATGAASYKLRLVLVSGTAAGGCNADASTNFFSIKDVGPITP